jgi:carboxypeptidase C (cathepsin A)
LLENLTAFTGLSEDFIKKKNYRIELFDFVTELLSDQLLQISLLDSRITSSVVPPGNYYEDPSLAAIKNQYQMAFNDYLSRDLDINDIMPYKSLSTKVTQDWQWGSASQGFVDFTEKLSKAICANDKLKIFSAMGTFDLTTPVATQEYTFEHLGLTPQQKKNISYNYYLSGHQVYSSEESLKQFRKDISVFFER